MVLPLVPLALIGIGVISGASGAAFGLKGGYDIKSANDRIRKAGARYDQERRKLEAHELVTNDSLRALGTRQERAIHMVVERMADFLRRHEKRVTESERLLVDGLESTPGQVTLEGSLGLEAISWMRGIVGSAATGVGINAGITTTVITFAAASTGTSISALSGVAATNATLAFLGGGSIASGGAGMAAGAAALNFVTIGPAILVSGLVVAGQGEKAKTKASENEAEISDAIADMQVTKAKFEAIGARAAELEELLSRLVVLATSALDLLESELFDPARHAVRFQQAVTLTIAVRNVASAKVVHESGDLNEEAVTCTIKYRTLVKEADDV
jgi:hypothetical protein